MTKVGDKVRFLNSVGGGIVTRIQGNIAFVDEDGFETPVLLKECVTVDTDRFYGKDPAPSKEVKTTVAPTTESQPQAAKPQEPKLDIVTTEHGDIINLVIGYEPRELKHLNTTNWDAYLINDSNYYLYFTYLTRSDTDRGWTTRYAGIVEPNIELPLGTVNREDLPAMDRIALQYVAFKRDGQFQLKAPVAVERPLDTTKFFKLHCYHENMYFDSPVIAIDIVKDDMPQRPMVIDSARLEDAMRQKRKLDNHGANQQRLKSKPNQRPQIIEVDLHIHNLLDSTAGLSNTDMLQAQLSEAKRVLDENANHKGQRIVLIHGKGEGVLRKALLDMLRHQYKNYEVQDASFREYGFGATQVTIH
ncbi:MAG: DUF2027 domain-containing protein [Muribaculaceae bacterium]|nr:DUF2027 domain-containing protein [Muribaculaceae bacterium]MDE6321698.1 DUF2027 domain-containing protein [Muribaculaceae bacterium]